MELQVLFGYIKPYRAEMKVREYETYQAVYCGLCKQMGKLYGRWSQLTLSFDMTFLSLLAIGLQEEFAGFEKQRCSVNPLKKKNCHKSCRDLTHTASLGMLMCYYKLKDNLQDNRFAGKLLSICAFPWAWNGRRKAQKAYPEMDALMLQCMQDQWILEQAQCDSIDCAAEPTAKALSVILASLSEKQDDKTALMRMGYLLGRYVYLMDAVDDLDRDQRRGSYNVFLQKFGDDRQSLIQAAVKALNCTVAEIAAAYQLVSLERFSCILDNIIYLGLHANIRMVMLKYQHDMTITSHQHQPIERVTYDKSI